MSNDISTPPVLCALSEQGQRAHAIIVAFLTELGLTSTGGCTPFYAPAEWKRRGEKYGTSSHLVVVYDGSPAKHVFNMDRAAEEDEPYAAQEALQAKLHEAGLYIEECTGWYSAVYSRG
jgi:predicted aconitase